MKHLPPMRVILTAVVIGLLSYQASARLIPLTEEYFPDENVIAWLKNTSYTESALGHKHDAVVTIDGQEYVETDKVTGLPSSSVLTNEFVDLSCMRYFTNFSGKVVMNSAGRTISRYYKKLKRANFSGTKITSFETGFSNVSQGTGHYTDGLEELILENCEKLTTVNLCGARDLHTLSIKGSVNITSFNMSMNGKNISKGDTIVNRKLEALDLSELRGLRNTSYFSNNKALRVFKLSPEERFYHGYTGYPPQFYLENTAIEVLDLRGVGYKNTNDAKPDETYQTTIDVHNSQLRQVITRESGLGYNLVFQANSVHLPYLDFPTGLTLGSSSQMNYNNKVLLHGDRTLKFKLVNSSISPIKNCTYDAVNGILRMNDDATTASYTVNLNTAKGSPITKYTVDLTYVPEAKVYLEYFDKSGKLSTELFTYEGSDEFSLLFPGDLEGKFRIKVEDNGKTYWLGPTRIDAVSPATARNHDGSALHDISMMSQKEYDSFEHVVSVLSPVKESHVMRVGVLYDDEQYHEHYHVVKAEASDTNPKYYFSTHESEQSQVTNTLSYPIFKLKYVPGNNVGEFHAMDSSDVITGINNLFTDDEDEAGVEGEAEYYTLQGIRVNVESLAPGIYICRQGGKTTKVVVTNP